MIADHLRASAFLIADGVLPSKEGRGYVLRRIMRRAMRHAHMLGCKEPLMWRLVPALVQQMGAAYGELVRAQPLITETLKLEESNFKQTLDRGLRLLDEETARLAPGEPFPGETAFRLYDTYGFPLDYQDVLRAQGRNMSKPRVSMRRWRGQRDEARRVGSARVKRQPRRCGLPCARKSAQQSSGVRNRNAEGSRARDPARRCPRRRSRYRR